MFNFNIYQNDKQILKNMLNKHQLSIHGIFIQEKRLVRLRKKLAELKNLLEIHRDKQVSDISLSESKPKMQKFQELQQDI